MPRSFASRLRSIRSSSSLVAFAAMSLGGVSIASADSANFTTPSLDRWNYAFSTTGSNGARGTASVFGAYESATGTSAPFEDRDADFLIGFNTSSQVPTGQGKANYLITSVKLTVTDSSGGYAYDNTYDAIGTYSTPANDTDAGRPVELHGVGFRNGYTALSYGANDNLPPGFEEATNYSTTAQTPLPTPHSRSAYPLGFNAVGTPRDVSSNVTEGFESNPWAIAQTNAVAPGGTVPVDAAFTFSVNLSDPFVLDYMQNALNTGNLGVMLSGVLPSAQQSSDGIPQYYNKENAAHRPDLGIFRAPGLEITYTIAPEPASVAVMGMAAGIGLLGRRRRNS